MASEQEAAAADAMVVDEAQRTLEDVLAFFDVSVLDLCGELDGGLNASLLSLLPLDEADNGGVPHDTARAGEGAVSPKSKPSSEKKKNAYVRRDPRKEIAELQDQALRLKERLSLLLRRRHSATNRALPYRQRWLIASQSDAHGSEDSQAPASPQWIEKALAEFELREQAERMNRELKAALARQLRLSSALNCQLCDEATTDDLELLSNEEQQLIQKYRAAPADHSHDHQRFTQLYHYLEALYYNTGLVMDKVGGSGNLSLLSSSSCSQQHRDPALGLVMEMATTTPVMCELESFEKLLWSRVVANTVTPECQHFSDKAKTASQRSSDCVEKYLTLKLSGEFGELTLNGICVARKFVDMNRVVYVLTTRSHCAESEIKLREDYWMVASKLANPTGSPMTRLQSFYRVHADQSASGHEQPSREIRELQEVVIKSAGDRIQAHQRLVQDVLMAEFGSDEGVGRHSPPSAAFHAQLEAS